MKGSDGILGTVLRPQLLCRPAMQPPVSFQQPWGATGVGAILGRLGGRGCIVRAQLGRPGFALGEGGREGSLGCARPVVPPPPAPQDAERALGAYLESQCRHFRCKVTYVGSGKTRFQIEVPESAARLALASHALQGQRKGFRSVGAGLGAAAGAGDAAAGRGLTSSPPPLPPAAATTRMR